MINHSFDDTIIRAYDVRGVYDKTLKDMVFIKPTNLIQFLSVTGVGQAKKDKYGNDFIKIIKENIE